MKKLLFIMSAMILGCSAVAQESDISVKIGEDGVPVYTNPAPDPDAEKKKEPEKSESREYQPPEGLLDYQENPYAKKQKVVQNVRFRWHGASPLVRVDINEYHHVNMILDTGAATSLITGDALSRINPSYKSRLKGPYLASGAYTSFLFVSGYELKSIGIGKLVEEDMEIIVGEDQDWEFDGLLGQDFLMNYKMEIDPARKIIRFESLVTGKKEYGGKPGIWWCRKFERLHSMRDFWKKMAKRSERRLRRRFRMSKQDLKPYLDFMIETTQDQINQLHGKAARYAVPQRYRSAPCEYDY